MAFWLIASTVLVILVSIVLKLLFAKGPKAAKKSPFDATCVRPAEPFVLDRKEREKVFKQSFSIDKVPENLDAIMIGSGIGSLSTAALLSKAGWKVLVLEQHHDAGGCCHTFYEKGFEFDVGIHYVGNLKKDSQFRILMDQITDGQLEWVLIDKYFDEVKLHLNNNEVKSYPIGSGKKEFRDSLLEQFPKEEPAIDKFIKLLVEARTQMNGMFIVKMVPLWLARFVVYSGLIRLITKFYKVNQQSLKDVLDQVTDNVELKAVLAYPFGDYGVLPSEAPFVMHASLLCHFWRGAYYPKGGASEIAFHTIPVIEKSGGKVLTRARVTQILVDDEGKACGVTVNPKKTTAEHNIYAPVIISDAGLVNTFKNMLPQDVAFKSRYYKYIKKLATGHAGFQLFVGLNGRTEELGLKARNYWCYTNTDYEHLIKDYMSLKAEEVVDHNIPLLFISFPSAKDPLYAERFPGKSACTVVTLTNYDWFKEWKETRKGKRGDDYETVKKQIGHKMWEQVLWYFPQLADKVDHFEIGSPLSHNHYIGSSHGEIYGLDHNMARFATEPCLEMRPDTDVPGLFLTGQDISTCGFAGAAYGGLLCASRVLERNLFLDLESFKATVKKAKDL